MKPLTRDDLDLEVATIIQSSRLSELYDAVVWMEKLDVCPPALTTWKASAKYALGKRILDHVMDSDAAEEPGLVPVEEKQG